MNDALKPDFEKLAEQYRTQADGQLDSHAERLGVSLESLERLGAGWDGQAITFPMMDADRRVIGIRRRFPDGRKLAVKDSRAGLFIPSDLPESGAVYFTEGPSDCAAVLSMGLAAIGRPSAADGIELVRAYCQRAAIQSAVIVGDNDEPGRMGAVKLAESLLDVVSDVRIVYPVDGFKDIRAEYLAGGLTAEILRDRAAQAEQWTRQAEAGYNFEDFAAMSAGDWPEIIPLESDDRPDFPIEALPKVLRDFVCDVSISTQTPPDMSGLLGLAIGGFAMSKRAEVQGYQDWREPLAVWICILLPPAERKSAILRIMAEPLKSHEKYLNTQLAEMIEKTHRQERILRSRYEKLIADAAKTNDKTERENLSHEAEETARELRDLEVVSEVRYTCEDATQEAIVGLIRNNGGRLLILSAEGDTFDIMSGRYSDKGKPNLGIYLKGHAGDDVQVNRVGRPEEFIEKPALSVGLLCQPDLLRDIAKQRAMKGRGLLARFLWAMPRSIIGNRDIHPKPINDWTKTAYGNAVWGLLSVGRADKGLHILELDQDATVRLDVFRGDMEGRLVGDCEPFQAWAGKLAGLVCRLAGVIHGYTFPADYFTKPIDSATMESAIQIAGYAIEHARYVFGALGADPTVTIAKKIASLLVEYTGTISRRDIFERVKGMADVQSSDDLVDPLRILCEHGYIRPIIEQGKSRGRPSERYEIHPGLLGKHSQKSQ